DCPSTPPTAGPPFHWRRYRGSSRPSWEGCKCSLHRRGSMARIIKPLERVTELVPADDPFPLPSKPQLLEVTPEMASSWLSYRSGHPKLRNLSKDVTARYQSMMESGRTKPGPVLFREATPEGY